MEKRDFFISYTQADEERAVWIAHTLDKHGYTSYVQALDIHPGQNFLSEMNKFLKNSANFIAVWSEAYSKSRWCMAELQSAFYAWNKESINCLLPVRVDSYPMEPLYAGLVYIDLPDMGAASEKELIDAVKHATAHSEKEADKAINSKYSENYGDDSIDSIFKAISPILIAIICVVALLLCISALRQPQEQLEMDNPIEAPELSAEELFQIGQTYSDGTVDYVKAREYYEQAAAKGNADALNSLGFLYSNGYGVEQDYAKAREYYEQAAAKGNANALYNLALLYRYGYGVEPDYTKAREYYEQAAAKGNADALGTLGLLSSREEDYDKAREYYEQAAAKGSASALANLGYLYKQGYGVEQDYAKAREYYEQAVAKGDAYALNSLGRLYEDGLGVEVDYAKALEYYQKAADAATPDAAANVARVREKMNG